jgi:hypothetical protein
MVVKVEFRPKPSVPVAPRGSLLGPWGFGALALWLWAYLRYGLQ